MANTDIFSLVSKYGSAQLQNIIYNLGQESAVTEGRTVIDYKLFDYQVYNEGAVISNSVITPNSGTVKLTATKDYFDKTSDTKVLSAWRIQNDVNPKRINNLTLDGKADEPYRFDRVAVDVLVFDCSVKTAEDNSIVLANASGISDEAVAVYKQINESGHLSLKMNGKELNYADPLGFAGSSVALQSENINSIYNKKTPKLIDPAIFLPETTSFGARIEFVNPVVIPAYITVAITVSLLGYKFLKNS